MIYQITIMLPKKKKIYQITINFLIKIFFEKILLLKLSLRKKCFIQLTQKKKAQKKKLTKRKKKEFIQILNFTRPTRWEHASKTKSGGQSVTSLIGYRESFSLKGRRLFGDQGLNDQSLHLPSRVRKPLPRIRVEQSSASLLQQPREHVLLVIPRRRFHQR